MAGVRGDAVAAKALALRGMVSENSVRRALGALVPEASEPWTRCALMSSVRQPLDRLWVPDLGATTKPMYGNQEGAEVGYHPHKPGRPSRVRAGRCKPSADDGFVYIDCGRLSRPECDGQRRRLGGGHLDPEPLRRSCGRDGRGHLGYRARPGDCLQWRPARSPCCRGSRNLDPAYFRFGRPHARGARQQLRRATVFEFRGCQWPHLLGRRDLASV